MTAGERTIIEALVAAGWADGRWVSEETELLDSALRSFGAPEDEARVMRAYAATPHAFDELDLDPLSDPERERLLELVVAMTLIDGNRHPRERSALDELAQRLAIGRDRADRVTAAAEERIGSLLELL
jgi:uncharacterized membrane protein YebE (DUF533 family)